MPLILVMSLQKVIEIISVIGSRHLENLLTHLRNLKSPQSPNNFRIYPLSIFKIYPKIHQITSHYYSLSGKDVKVESLHNSWSNFSKKAHTKHLKFMQNSKAKQYIIESKCTCSEPNKIIESKWNKYSMWIFANIYWKWAFVTFCYSFL